VFNVFAVPFSVPADSAPDKLQVELIYLQNDHVLKEKYRTAKNIVLFYEGLHRERFPQLCNQAWRVISMFGSTYLCEGMFSLMKFIKSRVRSSLTEENLSASLRLMCTNLHPDISTLCKRKN